MASLFLGKKLELRLPIAIIRERMIMDLILSHGREDLNVEVGSWDLDGPTLQGVESVQQRFGTTTTVKFISVDAMLTAQNLTGWEFWEADSLTLEVCQYNDLVETKEPDSKAPRFYGDFFLCHEFARAERHEIASLVQNAKVSLRQALRYLKGISNDKFPLA